MQFTRSTASATPTVNDAVDILAMDAGRLVAGRFDFSAFDHAVAWAASFGRWRASEGNANPGVPCLTGIVGGASSGKSTLFNNLTRDVGGSDGLAQLSRVAMRAHTTVGPVAAGSPVAIQAIESWLASSSAGGGARAFLLHDHPLRRATPETASSLGDDDAVTLITLDGRLRAGGAEIVVDTPDFTSMAARDEGDLARRMLAWFDRVIILVDEDRWYDEQIFGWLRERLDRLGVERLIVFNRCQRGSDASETLTDEERSRLADQAALMNADHVIVAHHPGRGLVRLSDETIDAVRAWLGRDLEMTGRQRTLKAHLGERAQAILDEDAQRRAAVKSLARALKQEAGAHTLSDKRIAYEILLSAEQRRSLDPLWQGFVRPAAWVAQLGRDAARSLPFAGGKGNDADADEAPTIRERGRAFFQSEVERITTRLQSRASQSELFAALGLDGDETAIRLAPGVEDDAVRLAAACDEAFEAFIRRFEEEAKRLKISILSSTGAVAGGIIGGVLALPAGGITAPVGAAIGAAVGLSVTAAGGRSVWRLARILLQTPELKQLWRAVGDYHNGIERHADEARERLVDVAERCTLDESDRLTAALKVLAKSGGKR